jgi:hypothetical protein
VCAGKTGTLERAASMKDDSSAMYSVEIAEERAVRATLLEEHRQYCFFISGLGPALVCTCLSLHCFLCRSKNTVREIV